MTTTPDILQKIVAVKRDEIAAYGRKIDELDKLIERLADLREADAAGAGGGSGNCGLARGCQEASFPRLRGPTSAHTDHAGNE